jgi:hypothetical protein
LLVGKTNIRWRNHEASVRMFPGARRGEIIRFRQNTLSTTFGSLRSPSGLVDLMSQNNSPYG